MLYNDSLLISVSSSTFIAKFKKVSALSLDMCLFNIKYADWKKLFLVNDMWSNWLSILRLPKLLIALRNFTPYS